MPGPTRIPTIAPSKAPQSVSDLTASMNAQNTNLQALLQQAASSVPVLLSPPAGFPWDFSQLDFKVYQVGSNISYHLSNPASLIPAAVWEAPLTQVFHVDLVNGSNANTGISTTRRGDFTNAVQYVTTAMAKANATSTASIILINGLSSLAPGPIFNAARGGGTHPTVPIAVISLGQRAIFTSEAAFTATVNGTYSNVYQWAQATQDGVLDWLSTYTPTYLDKNGVAQPCPDYNGNPVVLYTELTKVASLLLVSQTPNSWYNDGTNTYVRRADGAAVTNANTMALSGQAFNNTNATPQNLFMQNIDLYGGSNSSIQATYNMWFDNVRFRYCGLTTSSNGVSVAAQKGVTLFTNCSADANGGDGFNHHLATGGPGYLMTVNCSSAFTGRSPSVSNNGWTSHDTCIGVDINGVYTANSGGTCRSINNATAWLIGTQALGDRGDVIYGGGEVPTAFQVDNFALYFLDNCVAQASAQALANVGTGSLLYRNCTLVQGAVVNTGGGILQPFAV